MAGREKLEGQIFGDFTVVEYIGGKKYKVICNNCGETRELLATNIKKSVGVTCSKKKIIVDLEGYTIGEWEVLKYIGNKRYLCRCSCGVEKEVLKVNLLNGTSKSCGHKHNSYGDLTGQQFGEWEVVEKSGYLWKCRCSCGKISCISASDLATGKSKSCGHGYNEFYDISGKTFGLWEVIKYDGNQYYTCRCGCSNHTISHIRKADLLSGASTSCGCNKVNKIKETLLDRHNEIAPNRVSNPRNTEQILAVSSKENMDKFIADLGYKPTASQLATELGIQLHRTLTLLHQFDLIDKISLSNGVSTLELELLDFIKSITDSDIIHGDRKILQGKELDIYIPNLKLAIEFNGTYWHCSGLKGRNYHQYKTIECTKRGIRLIHIFEYEWLNETTKAKLLGYLKDIISNDTNIIYARKTVVKPISFVEAKLFCIENHLQDEASGEIYLGEYLGSELLAVMIIGKPRFNSNYKYELIRVCFKSGVKIVGGLEKLWKYAISNYDIHNMITYCDISKFTGNGYTKLGFKVDNTNCITQPNYVWVMPTNNQVIKRYQTTKDKLIKLGYKDLGNTEEEIMNNLGYLKIYDCGNLRMIWERG